MEAMARRMCIAAAACLSALLLLLPVNALALNKAIWGTAYVSGKNQFPMYKQLGVRIVEADLDWYNIAPRRPSRQKDPQDPTYKWPSDIQQLVTQARRYHMQVLLQIIGSPRWANGGHAWSCAPQPAAYAAFAVAAAKEYPSVHLWMVWGEPNRKPNFEPETSAQPGATLNAAQRVAPHNYAKMLDAAYGALKGVSRLNKVIGGSTYTTGDIDTQQWIENLRLPDGKPPRMDMYAQNPFTWEPPAFSASPSPDGEVQFPDLKRLGQWIDEYLRPGMPIFLSEFTIPTQPDREFNFYATDSAQAQIVTEVLHEASDWPRIYALGWIHVYDDPPESYGGLLTQNGTPKPAFYAFEHG